MSTPEEKLGDQIESYAEMVKDTSSDATHSSYEEATDVPETNPPSGPMVIQERGKPAEVTPSTRSKSSTKAS